MRNLHPSREGHYRSRYKCWSICPRVGPDDSDTSSLHEGLILDSIKLQHSSASVLKLLGIAILTTLLCIALGIACTFLWDTPVLGWILITFGAAGAFSVFAAARRYSRLVQEGDFLFLEYHRARKSLGEEVNVTNVIWSWRPETPAPHDYVQPKNTGKGGRMP